MEDEDPLRNLKRVASYVILGVWAATFIGSLFTDLDSAQLLAVQAALMMVAGGLFADQYRGGKGGAAQ